MGGARSKLGTNDRGIYDFKPKKKLKGRDYLGEVEADWRLTLKYIIKRILIYEGVKRQQNSVWWLTVNKTAVTDLY